MSKRFQHLEQQYYRMRGKYAVGRMSEQEFDAALHDMAVEDAQGNYWMLGANSGEWYYFDGTAWVSGDPDSADFPIDAEATPSLEPVHTMPALTAEQEALLAAPKTEYAGAPALALPFFVTSIVLIIVAVIAFVLFQGDQVSLANASALPTRISPPTRVAAQPVKPPTRFPTPTLPRPTTVAKVDAASIPVTVTPQPLVIEPTSTAPALTSIPTVTPGARFTTEPGQVTTLNDTSFEVTAEPQAPSAAPQNPSGLPANVYVTNLRFSPNPPPQRQQIHFTATFLNTQPQPVPITWRVVFLSLDKNGHNKDWGQSEPVSIQVPPGQSEFSLSYVPVTSFGPCVVLQILAAQRMPDNARVFFPSPGGGSFATSANFC